MEPILSLDLTTLHRRTSMKWRRYPEDVLPLWVAEMDTPLAPAVREELLRVVTEGDTGYPEGNAYAEAFAVFAAEEWGWTFDPARQAVLSPDVMQGIAMLLAQAVRPGERVVINSPVYAPFWAVVRNAGAELVDVPLTEEGRLDLDAHEAAYAQGVAVHLLSSPHNPTGVVHTREELTRLAELARRHDVLLLADEIHSPLVGPGERFVPLLDVPGGEHAISLVSASKAWNLAGLKGALIIAGPEQLEQLRALSYESTRGAASHVALRAHTAALTGARDWLVQLRTELQANRELLDRLLADHLPAVRHRLSRGTYLAWLDCRELGLANPARHFLDEARVALNDGAAFGPRTAGFARINLATSPAIITEAVTRMGRSVSGPR
ncbi:MalY/PatB family protein [Desertihabitans brevis]|uniref:MalY/PatB family protein n=1 Tax=Desertihabitans brevis TaxID=2268447 RepID=UPI001F298B6F|nr:aminotransferase class I/II-fold pyridoxal phosphate-dependent enzyme [Desertihabitans brevis]